ARPAVEKWVGGFPRFKAVREAIAKEGGKAVFLVRLSPLFPFNLINYAFGLTRIPFPSYVAASWAGMLPGTLAYVYLGGVGRATVDAVSGEDGGMPTVKLALYVVGALATLVVTSSISKRASSILDGEMQGDNGETTEDRQK
ncbi:hypothetical protein CYMTET_16828, partial [Cymbomonas tetramitiformis]